MKRPLPVLMVFGVFLGGAGEAFALPKCEGSPLEEGTQDESDLVTRFWNHCKGTLTYLHSFYRYTGEWKDGKKNGQGSWFWGGAVPKLEGNKYVGEWKDDRKHGKGTYTYANGRVVEGTWVNGKRKLGGS